MVIILFCMSKSEGLEVLGKFYGKPVYENPLVAKALEYLNSAEDWKFRQFQGEIDVEALSQGECKIKLQNGIQLYLVKRRRTWLDYDWILLYAYENGSPKRLM
jgi:hypothetical protein